MDKNSVIAIRSALLDKDNRAVKIVFDNGVILSPSSDIVIWDDDKEIITGFTADSDGGSYSADLPIRIICSTYEHIQFIMGNTNSKKLESVIDKLSSAVPITDDNKDKIIEWYKKLYDYKFELLRKNYDPVDIKRD